MTERNGTMILLVIICGGKTQSLNLWEQIKDYEIQRKLDHDYPHSLYSLTSTVMRNEMGCAVNIEDMTNAYTILIKKPQAEEKRDIGMDKKMII
jgi:hypothetical protein